VTIAEARNFCQFIGFIEFFYTFLYNYGVVFFFWLVFFGGVSWLVLFLSLLGVVLVLLPVLCVAVGFGRVAPCLASLLVGRPRLLVCSCRFLARLRLVRLVVFWRRVVFACGFVLVLLVRLSLPPVVCLFPLSWSRWLFPLVGVPPRWLRWFVPCCRRVLLFPRLFRARIPRYEAIARKRQSHIRWLERLGPNVWHDSPAATMATLEELEETAKLLLLSPTPPAPLTENQIDELRRTFGARW